jgi:hypothetical protein
MILSKRFQVFILIVCATAAAATATLTLATDNERDLVEEEHGEENSLSSNEQAFLPERINSILSTSEFLSLNFKQQMAVLSVMQQLLTGYLDEPLSGSANIESKHEETQSK